MEDVAERSFARLAEWKQARYHAECSAVAALHHVTAAAAAGARPLPYTLQLEVSGRGLGCRYTTKARAVCHHLCLRGVAGHGTALLWGLH